MTVSIQGWLCAFLCLIYVLGFCVDLIASRNICKPWKLNQLATGLAFPLEKSPRSLCWVFFCAVNQVVSHWKCPFGSLNFILPDPFLPQNVTS